MHALAFGYPNPPAWYRSPWAWGGLALGAVGITSFVAGVYRSKHRPLPPLQPTADASDCDPLQTAPFGKACVWDGQRYVLLDAVRDECDPNGPSPYGYACVWDGNRFVRQKVVKPAPPVDVPPSRVTDCVVVVDDDHYTIPHGDYEFGGLPEGDHGALTRAVALDLPGASFMLGEGKSLGLDNIPPRIWVPHRHRVDLTQADIYRLREGQEVTVMTHENEDSFWAEDPHRHRVRIRCTQQ